MKIRTVLEKTYKLLENRKHWIKGISWATEDGTHTYPREACRYCLHGAVFIACNFKNSTADKVELFLDEISLRVNKKEFVPFNDSRRTSHVKLLEFIKKAISSAKRKGV